MTTIVVDATMRKKLLAADQAIEFRDEAGNLVRRFVDTANGPPPVPDDVEPTEEELDRREREERRYTSEQVLDRLRGLRK